MQPPGGPPPYGYGPPGPPGPYGPPGPPGQYPGFQPPPAGSYGAPARVQRTVEEATIALILGIAAWFCFPVGFVAIYFGARARRKIRENPTELTGDGMALAGMIVGGVIGTAWLVFWLFYLLMVVGIIGAAALSSP